MSHETVLNEWTLGLQEFEGTSLDSDQGVKAIKRAGNNLMVIINDILDFFKIEEIK
jgi:signal transduction histidine kinase